MAESERARRQDGFTLVELMVVVLVIAILIAIAIPTFLGARDRANDRTTQSNLRFAFIAARTYFNGEARYTGDPVAMRATDPALTWTSAAPSLAEPQRTVTITASPDGMTVVLGAASPSGSCFFIRDVMADASAGTSYARTPASGGTCTTPADPGQWHTSWP